MNSAEIEEKKKLINDMLVRNNVDINNIAEKASWIAKHYIENEESDMTDAEREAIKKLYFSGFNKCIVEVSK